MIYEIVKISKIKLSVNESQKHYRDFPIYFGIYFSSTEQLFPYKNISPTIVFSLFYANYSLSVQSFNLHFKSKFFITDICFLLSKVFSLPL